MDLIMQDQITAKESISYIDVIACTGCDVLSSTMTENEWDENSVTTAWGHTYCHIDCYRDGF